MIHGSTPEQEAYAQLLEEKEETPPRRLITSSGRHE